MVELSQTVWSPARRAATIKAVPSWTAEQPASVKNGWPWSWCHTVPASGMDRHPCQVCARVSVTIDVHISQAAAVRAKDRLPKSDVDWVEGLIFMVSIYKTIPRQKFQKFCLMTRQMEEVLQRPREKSLAATQGIELVGYSLK